MGRLGCRTVRLTVLGLVVVTGSWTANTCEAQQNKRKPQRAEPPKIASTDFAGTFFPDVSTVLQGELPAKKTVVGPASTGGSTGGAMTGGAADSGAAGDPMGWAKAISPATLEDAVKASKQRLEGILTSAAKFKGGGNTQARREFSLQAMLFSIIESYPGDVRWKKSAGAARERFVRVANNCKTNTDPVFAECKQRLQDLNDLIGGSPLEGTAGGELAWGEVIDRGPLMELLEWCQQENILNFSSSPANFEANKDELQKFAELVAVLGKMSIMPEMPDAADGDYKKLAEQMVEQAGQIVLAVKTNSPDVARQAAGQIGQSCAKCHDGYR